MNSLRAPVICIALLAAWPAAAVDAVPSEAIAMRALAPLSSPRALAMEAALDRLEAAGDPIEERIILALREFYKSREYGLLWLGGPNGKGPMQALREAMNAAAAYGLDPALYATPGLTTGDTNDVVRLGEADVAFSIAAARFATHISSGRVRPADISSLITLEPEVQDLGAALENLARAEDVDAALEVLEPPHPQYRALKAALAELQASAATDTRIVVPEGKLLKPGGTDERVTVLRKRLAIPVAPGAAPDLYDEALVEAVKAVQRDHGLREDGIVGPRTLFALNGRSREEDIAALVANLERWRWMPRDLGAFHIIVNVPEFMVRVVKDGSVMHETRVIVGTPENRTPTFSHVMDHMVVNPYWHVPASIVRKEMLPEIRRNPYGYFSRRGYQVLARIGGRMRVIDPRWVNWYMVNPRAIQIRQVPGDFNALGRIKFMFPNQHSVYLHDTPTKSLFERDQRAFSHGCVRVDNPLEFADSFLPVAAPEWNSARLQKLYGGRERRVNLDTPIPVHLSYFTAWADADGTIRYFEDIYGYDQAMGAFLGL
jgi:murein L,D-transpeptidase YcbB/YkuD